MSHNPQPFFLRVASALMIIGPSDGWESVSHTAKSNGEGERERERWEEGRENRKEGRERELSFEFENAGSQLPSDGSCCRRRRDYYCRRCRFLPELLSFSLLARVVLLASSFFASKSDIP